MNRKVTLASLTAGLLTVSAFAAAPAQAGERTCRGTIGSTTVDNLLVPQDATCNETARPRLGGRAVCSQRCDSTYFEGWGVLHFTSGLTPT